MSLPGDPSRARKPVNYSLDTHSEAWFYMIRMGRCWQCGHIIIDEPVPGGTMITCLTGDLYTDGEPGCGQRWWIDE